MKIFGEALDDLTTEIDAPEEKGRENDQPGGLKSKSKVTDRCGLSSVRCSILLILYVQSGGDR